MKYEPIASVGASDIEELMMPYWTRPSDPDWNLIDTVQEIIESLDEPHRTVLQLVFYDRLPYSELAPALGIKSKGHAHRKAQKAIEEFKKAFEAHPMIAKNPTIIKREKDSWEHHSYEALEAHWFLSAEVTELWSEKDIAASLSVTQKQISKVINDAFDGRTFDIRELDELVERCGRLAAAHIKSSMRSDIHGVHDLIVGKQRDYGHENILLSGTCGVAVRMMDKIARLNNLLSKPRGNVVNEPLADTWADILGYATIYRMVRKETFTKPLSKMETTNE